MIRPITHLFFDLGNVLVGLRSGEKLKALAQRKGESVEAFCEKIWSHERAHDYERGRHTCDEYFALLAEDLDLAHAQQELQDAFCDIFYPLPERVALATSTCETVPTCPDLEHLRLPYPTPRIHIRLLPSFPASDLLPRGGMSQAPPRHLQKSSERHGGNPGNIPLYR